jgi:hypothetical protein
MPETKVILYCEEDGTVPIHEWFDTLNKKSLLKCGAKLTRLKALGYELRRPEADYLRDGIYELRVGLQGINYRILYFFYKDIAAVVSHGLVKEKIVPPKEIELAVERMNKFYENPKAHSYTEEKQ